MTTPEEMNHYFEPKKARKRAMVDCVRMDRIKICANTICHRADQIGPDARFIKEMAEEIVALAEGLRAV